MTAVAGPGSWGLEGSSSQGVTDTCHARSREGWVWHAAGVSCPCYYYYYYYYSTVSVAGLAQGQILRRQAQGEGPRSAARPYWHIAIKDLYIVQQYYRKSTSGELSAYVVWAGWRSNRSVQGWSPLRHMSVGGHSSFSRPHYIG